MLRPAGLGDGPLRPGKAPARAFAAVRDAAATVRLVFLNWRERPVHAPPEDEREEER